MGFLWFGFSEEKMRKKLERLHASVERHPEKADEFEGILATYQDKINKNQDKIEDKKDMNMRIEAVQLALTNAKRKESRAEIKENVELKPAMG